MTDERLTRDIKDYMRGTFIVYGERGGEPRQARMPLEYKRDLLRSIAAGIDERGGGFVVSRVEYFVNDGMLKARIPTGW